MCTAYSTPHYHRRRVNTVIPKLSTFFRILPPFAVYLVLRIKLWLKVNSYWLSVVAQLPHQINEHIHGLQERFIS